MSIDNVWVVVPVNNLSTNADKLVSNLTGGFVTPQKYAVRQHPVSPADVADRKVTDKRKQELLKLIEDYKVEKNHPHYGETPLDFTNRIVFVEANAGYKTYTGVTHLENFEINVAKDWNMGINYAVEHGASHVFVLRSVSEMDPWIIKDVYDKLVLEGKEVAFVGTSFLLSATSTLRADERFNAWWFDLDFIRQAQGKSIDFSVDYSSIAEIDVLKLTPEVVALTEEDIIQFNTKWQITQ